MFACIVSGSASGDGLLDIARAFSPRAEASTLRHAQGRPGHGRAPTGSASPRARSRGEPQGTAVVIDVSGLGRIVGDPPAVGRELAREARERGIDAAVGVAATRTAATLGAWCLVPGASCERVPGAWQAQGAGRVMVIPPGEERAAVGAMPIGILAALGFAEHLPTLGRWGLRTLGELAALAPADLCARLGVAGLVLHRMACGRDDRPLVPRVDPARFDASLDLEWPIDTLEPLTFVLARLLEPLSAALERADRGAAAIALTLTLVTRAESGGPRNEHPGGRGPRNEHVIRLDLPAPMRDARTLRTLLALALEARPAPAGIDRVAIAIDPTPGRIVQHSLLQRALPSPECLSTLLARLEALMGAGRVGTPALVDSHEPGAFELRSVECGVWSRGGNPQSTLRNPQSVLRRFRLPVAARVEMQNGRPVRVTTARRGLAGGRVVQCAGPWRTSGGWWTPPRIHTDLNGPRMNTEPHGSSGSGSGQASARGPREARAQRDAGRERVGVGPYEREEKMVGPRSGRAFEQGAATSAPSVSEAWQAVGVGPHGKWDNDEWDVALPDGVYRISRDRVGRQWSIDGILD